MPRQYTPRVSLICPICETAFTLAPCFVRRTNFCSLPCRNAGAFIPPVERFWKHVDKDGPTPSHMPHLGGCWLWTGKRTHGYGLFFVVRTRPVMAHRFSYELAKGPLTPGNDCCHHCDTPACVRPDHLFDGTRSENLTDGANKGLFTCGERNGQSKLTAEQVTNIRARYAAGGIRQRELAAEYGIDRAMVSYIVTGKSWRHLP